MKWLTRENMKDFVVWLTGLTKVIGEKCGDTGSGLQLLTSGGSLLRSIIKSESLQTMNTLFLEEDKETDFFFNKHCF